MKRRACAAALLLATSLLWPACSDEGGFLPYDPDTTVVVGPDGAKRSVTPDGSDCIDIEQSNDCVKPQDTCGDGGVADVIVDAEGKVIEIVCHPTEAGTIVVKPGETSTVPDNTTIVDVENGDDGPDHVGDLSVDGNKTTLYGDSPETTVVDGNVTLRGNQSVVRGMRITGDLTFDGNGSKAYYCVVEGDVIFRGGSNLIAGCIVFGNITSSGNGDRVIANYVRGNIEVKNAAECDKNRAFSDADDDRMLDQSERDASTPLACGNGGP